MKLSVADIEGFVSAYRLDTGNEIGDDEAIVLAERLVSLFSIIYRPLDDEPP